MKRPRTGRRYQTCTELVSLAERHPYAIGTRLHFVAGAITELEAAANACFDQFFSGPESVYVPWGSPCNRLENGRIPYVHTLTVCGPTGCEFN